MAGNILSVPNETPERPGGGTRPCAPSAPLAMHNWPGLTYLLPRTYPPRLETHDHAVADSYLAGPLPDGSAARP